MRVRRVLTLLMMLTLTVVSGTSLAAAICQHQDAQGHIAARQGDDLGHAVVAQMEEAAGSAASKRGTLADAGSLAMPAFILPPASAPLDHAYSQAARPRPPGVEKVPSRSIPPLLQPPSV